MRTVVVALALLVSSLATSSPALAQRGTQLSPDDALVLVNKRLGQQQWAIVTDLDFATVTGNVFNLDGSDPQFVFCTIDSPTIDTQEDFIGVTVEISCSVAVGCDALPCGGEAWQPVGTRSIPGSFFLPSGAGQTVPTPTATPAAQPTFTFSQPQPTFTSSGGGCCRVCTTGKACGNSCIAVSLTCHQPPGCAC